jgi:hypothetical protein
MSGSWTTELVAGVDSGAVGSVGWEVGNGVRRTKGLGTQSKGIKCGGNGVVGRRGTMAPLARRNRVRPVRRSGPMQTPSSAFGSALAAVW